MQSKLIRGLCACTALVFIFLCTQFIQDWTESAKFSAPGLNFHGVESWALVLLAAICLYTLGLGSSKIKTFTAVKSSTVAAYVTFGATALVLSFHRGHGPDPLAIACAQSVIAAFAALFIALFFGAANLFVQNRVKPIERPAA